MIIERLVPSNAKYQRIAEENTYDDYINKSSSGSSNYCIYISWDGWLMYKLIPRTVCALQHCLQIDLFRETKVKWTEAVYILSMTTLSKTLFNESQIKTKLKSNKEIGAGRWSQSLLCKPSSMLEWILSLKQVCLLVLLIMSNDQLFYLNLLVMLNKENTCFLLLEQRVYVEGYYIIIIVKHRHHYNHSHSYTTRASSFEVSLVDR